jgi:hypothetical protein
MAVNFVQYPDIIVSGFNEMNFVVSSSISTTAGFKFKSKLLDSVGATIAEFYHLKQPTYGNLLFDAHRTIENYLSYDISNLIAGTTGWQKGVNVFKKFKLNVQEYVNYNGASALYASGSSADVIAVNSSMSWQDWVNFGLGDRYVGSSSRKFMTNQPARIKIRTGDSYELGTIAAPPREVKYLKIETYNFSNTLVQTYTIDNPYYLLPDDGSKFPSILCGPLNLNASTLTTGSQPVITSAIKYYQVACYDSSNLQMTEWKEFELDQDCLRDSYNRLYFLNSLGRFDAFNFNQVSEDNIEVGKSNYDKLLGTLSLSGFTHSTYERSTSVFHSKIKQKYKLRSGFVDTATALWLKELIASPIVYMIVPINTGNTWVAVNIDETSYTSKKVISDKLFNIELNISLSNDSQRQRL